MTTVKTTQEAAAPSLSPDRLMQVGMGFWASKVLLTAVKFRLFTELGSRTLSAKEIQGRIGLHPRGLHDFLDALVALRFLVRDVKGYANTPETAFFLDGNSPAYLGDMLEMANDRLWEFWGRLEEGLRTGKPQNETRAGGTGVLDVLYADAAKRDLFVKAMISLSSGSSLAVANDFDFSGVQSFCDIGGGPGTLSAAVSKAHPSVACVNFDLPPVEPVFREYMRRHGLEGKVRFQGGDCLKDSLPAAQVYAMGHLLHGLSRTDQDRALGRVFQALPSGGHLLVIESLIDDDRRENAFGLLMSLDMLIETTSGRNFTEAELSAWMSEAGFRDLHCIPLIGPHAMLVGRKP